MTLGAGRSRQVWPIARGPDIALERHSRPATLPRQLGVGNLSIMSSEIGNR